MKTLAIRLLVILMTVSNLAAAAVYIPNELSTTVKFETTSESRLVKAAVIDGELRPVVDLPVIEIRAHRFDRILVPALFNGKEVLAIVDLPQIEVIGHLEPVNTSEPVATVDLPEITITGESKSDRMVKASMIRDGEYLATVDLPEIEVRAFDVEHNIHPSIINSDCIVYTVTGTSEKAGSSDTSEPLKILSGNRYMIVDGKIPGRQILVKAIIESAQKYLIPLDIQTCATQFLKVRMN